ncbi:hypothetical protein RHSIM_Rhsim07G0155100 [Rhododendron simsii]|uniref:Pentatricopeptide repeat-containing protein n=1 Tax=Rhododendron simsii TaxID=118357 RepID=A0A834LI13_RHOSS|nr:hypothetical protein RHSIM_Rhsim07G0155100 [Rhododendron simsii]
MVEPNIYLYKVMIRAYTQSHLYVSTINVYKQMLRDGDPQGKDSIFPGKFTYPFVIKSCGGLLCLDLGKQVHGQACKFGLKSNTVIENSLLYMYIRCENLSDADKMFEEMSERDVISWNSVITGHTKLGLCEKSKSNQMEGIEPDWVSLIAVLPPCAQLGALEGRDVISWSTMIGGFANHGKAHEAIVLFQDMQRAKVEPNEITFVGLLLAFAHAGFLDEGLKYFDSMRKDYNIEPGIEHYGCLVDLLGRTGLIDRALESIMNMPMKPDSAIWGSLLSCCRTHNNIVTTQI